jgi:hypothetical protein
MSAGVGLLRRVGARLVLAAAAAAPLAGTPLTAAAQVDAGPYVPSPSMIVDEMLALGAIRADDYLIDLGSGDGRIPITAARRFGARGPASRTRCVSSGATSSRPTSPRRRW